MGVGDSQRYDHHGGGSSGAVRLARRLAITVLLCCLLMMVSSCGIAVSRSEYLELGDKRYTVMEFSTRHLIGPNLRELHTVEIDQEGKAKVIHSSAATSSGLLQAILPGGASAAVFSPLAVLGRVGTGGSAGE